MKLTSKQRAMVDLIQAEARAAGYSARVGKAMVVNAYAESNLDPCAVAGFRVWSGCDHQPRAGGENSVGLFQLNVAGAGAGMTVAQRKDPRLNTRGILQELARVERSAGPVVTGAATLGDAVEAFCRFVERPAAALTKGQERRALALKLFPEDAVPTNGTSSIPSGPNPVPTASSGTSTVQTVVLWGMLIAAAGVGTIALRRALR